MKIKQKPLQDRGWIITGLTKMSKTEWVWKAVAHSIISFIFSIFPWLCKIIRNKRKICWMPSHSLLEQGNKPFQALSDLLWVAESFTVVNQSREGHLEWLLSDGEFRMVQVESTEVWIILKNLFKEILFFKDVCWYGQVWLVEPAWLFFF